MMTDNANFERRNRPWETALLFLLALLPLAAPTVAATNSAPVDAQVTVAFGGQCEDLLIRTIRAAKSDIYIAIYTITDRAICSALVEAVARGVTVRMKYDKESSKFPAMRDAIGYLKKSGVTCKAISSKVEAKMHHKFAIIDRARVLTGSYNYTAAAGDLNYENLVLIESRSVAQRFLAQYTHIH